MLSQMSLRLSSILLILFSFFCSTAVISTIPFGSPHTHSPASVILLLITSSVFFISVIVIFITVCSRVLLNFVLSCVQLYATLWTVAHQASLSMGFFQTRVLVWVASILSAEDLLPEDLPNPGRSSPGSS